jgi:hypothetical protein
MVISNTGFTAGEVRSFPAKSPGGARARRPSCRSALAAWPHPPGPSRPMARDKVRPRSFCYLGNRGGT